MRARRVSVGLLVGASLVAAGAAGAPARAAAPPGPFLTLLFSRTETGNNDVALPGCRTDTRNVARLDTAVAPFLAGRGMVGTGSLQTGATDQSKDVCLHFHQTTATSWDLATRLQQSFRWQFVSHSASYPLNFAGLTPEQKQAETCGSAQTIRDHGLTGAEGLFAWPRNRWNEADQLQFVAPCFAFGRQYGSGTTTIADATTSPFWQKTAQTGGGACNVATLPCATISPVGAPTKKYTLPASLITKIRQRQPGEWFTLQSYVLVTGTNPAFSTSPMRWDCTSSDPARHWTNDTERYCWNDYQAIIRAVPAAMTVTDPLTVARAFGRPGF